MSVILTLCVVLMGGLFVGAKDVDVTLVADYHNIAVGNITVRAAVYNNAYVPPTIRLSRNDTLRLRLINRIGNITNIHYHGMNVLAPAPADDIFIEIQPRREFHYVVPIPFDHPQGLFWYHSHAMNLSENQVHNGMSGAIVVEGLLDPFPGLEKVTEHIMLLKDISILDGKIVDNNDEEGTVNIVTLNGLVDPRYHIAPNETQFWRIANIGANRYNHLYLDGLPMYEIAYDGNRHNHLVEREYILLPPSSRTEILVVGPKAGIYKLRALEVNTGPAGDTYEEATLLTLYSSGTANPSVPLPTNFPFVTDLRKLPVNKNRTIVFTESEDGDTFYIDGKEYDPNRVDTVVDYGDLESWDVINNTTELHVFHIHQLDFQVVEINNQAVEFEGRQDTVNIPYTNSTSFMSYAKILIPFFNITNIGRYVYHCHIMEHEDNGMMAVVEVQQKTVIQQQ